MVNKQTVDAFVLRIEFEENKAGSASFYFVFIPFGEVFKAESQLVVVSVEFRITWNFRQEDLSDLKWTLRKIKS